ncbi:hypothetical protein VFPPC_16365 [Pochonia chlamydosporia 170]|uniref:Uncharacterized protein n=1 Tax=Pochonia chlamydosporia 170 TaxID=1380566 RepID=A0A179FB12_METCM|nr:hypothetical protein VFPPC_16365 [Pochonia chlamydosporia 170]OAQ62654.2 hypothetical protein VFPPC_16365 [Pochonia chlamydosporia 170]
MHISCPLKPPHQGCKGCPMLETIGWRWPLFISRSILMKHRIRLTPLACASRDMGKISRCSFLPSNVVGLCLCNSFITPQALSQLSNRKVILCPHGGSLTQGMDRSGYDTRYGDHFVLEDHHGTSVTTRCRILRLSCRWVRDNQCTSPKVHSQEGARTRVVAL